MKRGFIIFFLLAAVSWAVFSQNDDDYDLEIIISEINGISAPFVRGDFIIFTAQPFPRHVGIAFDFELFRVIHSYQRINIRDIDNTIISSLYFYVLKIPENVDIVSYKIISDSLWSIDPLNPDTKFDPVSNSVLSTVSVRRDIAPVTRIVGQGRVRFVYRGDAGQKIQVGGSFTNWDPFIYEMKETRAGLYEFELPLLPGTHYYNFYKGMTAITDPANPSRAYTADGRTASVIEVK